MVDTGNKMLISMEDGTVLWLEEITPSRGSLVLDQQIRHRNFANFSYTKQEW
jgi:hypothetical protein